MIGASAAGAGGNIYNTENQNNLDVYDYCDKMMKEMSHLDKKLENRLSHQKVKNDLSLRYSSTNKRDAEEILNGYLNE